MRSILALAIPLHALVSQCHGNAQADSLDERVQASVDAVDTLVGVLLARPPQALPVEHTNLEHTTLGKSQAVASRQASPLTLASTLHTRSSALRSPPSLLIPPSASVRPLSRRPALGDSATYGAGTRTPLTGRGAMGATPAAALGRGMRVAASAASIGYGSDSVQGTKRQQNEDRVAVKLNEGPFEAMASVFDGHGGNAVSIWLQDNYFNYIKEQWPGRSQKECLTEAHLAADKEILKAPNFFSERGIGGSKCGSSAATFLVHKDSATGARNFTTANVGDCRVYLVRGGKLVQLTEDHIPDDERERKRIESFNPTPKQPLVKKVGDTWRLGGILALSRAFGDAFLKSTGQFEGLPQGGDGGAYSSGFGLIAEPYVSSGALEGDDTYAILSSDGLFANEERGGGSGLSEEDILAPFLSGPAAEELGSISKDLVKKAQAKGSLDDVTVIAMKL